MRRLGVVDSGSAVNLYIIGLILKALEHFHINQGFFLI